jgi:hypothetical protein
MPASPELSAQDGTGAIVTAENVGLLSEALCNDRHSNNLARIDHASRHAV